MPAFGLPRRVKAMKTRTTPVSKETQPESPRNDSNDQQGNYPAAKPLTS
jgi:hypothetical protein